MLVSCQQKARLKWTLLHEQLGQCARIPAFRTFTDTRSPCRHLALHVLHEESRGADRAHHAPAPSGKAISWRVHTDTSMDRTAVLEIPLCGWVGGYLCFYACFHLSVFPDMITRCKCVCRWWEARRRLSRKADFCWPIVIVIVLLSRLIYVYIHILELQLDVFIISSNFK